MNRASRWLLAVPLLHVDEMSGALSFYRDRLGFEVSSEHRDDGGAEYAVVSRDEAALHLSTSPGGPRGGGATVVFVHAVDAIALELRERGVGIELEPVDRPWGTRECFVRDPFGNQIRLTEPRTDPG
ncbi:MAG: glyoxalase superfamily protein [Dehalococcoidia bacterium]